MTSNDTPASDEEATSGPSWIPLAAAVGLVLVAVLAFGVFGVQTLFIDDEVDEAAPVFTLDAPDPTEDTADPADDEPATETTDAPPTTPGPVEPIEPVTVAGGIFVDGDHPTEGTAVVLSDGDQQRVLRFESDFATDNGPDLNVYLAPSADVDSDFIDLGPLTGNIGSQNYDLDPGIDLEVYDTVVIWCVRFGVGFGSAPLA